MKITKLGLLALVLGFLLPVNRVMGAEPVRVRLGTLAPKGSSYVKHLQAMGEQWRQRRAAGCN